MLFDIDMDQNMPISVLPTLFDHFHFHPFSAFIWWSPVTPSCCLLSATGSPSLPSSRLIWKWLGCEVEVTLGQKGKIDTVSIWALPIRGRYQLQWCFPREEERRSEELEAAQEELRQEQLRQEKEKAENDRIRMKLIQSKKRETFFGKNWQFARMILTWEFK